MGFPGGNKQVHRRSAERRAAPSKFGRWRDRGPNDARPPAARDDEPPLPAPRQLAWSLVQPVAALEAAEAAAVARIERDGEAKAVAGLAHRFGSQCSCAPAASGAGRKPASWPNPQRDWTSGWPRPVRAAWPPSRRSPQGWTYRRCRIGAEKTMRATRSMPVDAIGWSRTPSNLFQPITSAGTRFNVLTQDSIRLHRAVPDELYKLIKD